MDTYPDTLGKRFIRIAKTHANDVALRYVSGEEITYKELHHKVEAAGILLHELDIVRGDVIAIFNQKSSEAFALIIAALTKGVIYCNLDYTSPEQRLQRMLEKARPKALFVDQGINIPDSLLQSGEYRYVDLQKQVKEVNFVTENSRFSLNTAVTESDPAYIMFTSGSTGFPKGAVMSHRNVLNLIDWAPQQFDFKPDEVLSNVNPIYFDNSVFDFYTALFNGFTLVPVSVELSKQPAELLHAVAQTHITSWFSVPSLLVYLQTMKVLNQERIQHIRRFIFGGEGYPKRKLHDLYQLVDGKIDLWNVYGPTECTCICSAHKVEDADFEDMKSLTTLGYLIPNFDYVLVDEQNNRGELALIGPQVGLGYINDCERTESSFVETDAPWLGKMYLTGDLVEKDEFGRLHFKGRTDNQIKHMGYRIELEEIEAAFQSMKDVHEVGVIYKSLGNGMGQIVCFLHTNDHAKMDVIKASVKRMLPPYMIPQKIKQMEQLPKNANGKIDRNRLNELL